MSLLLAATLFAVGIGQVSFAEAQAAPVVAGAAADDDPGDIGEPEEGDDAPPPADGTGDIGGGEHPSPLEPGEIDPGRPSTGGPWQPDNCTATVKKSVANIKNTFQRVQRWSDANDTSNTDSMSVHVNKSGTFKWSLSVSVEEELSAWVFAKVKGTINGGIEKSWTTDTGVTRNVTLKPHTLTTVDYGVWNEVVQFRKYRVYPSCAQKDIKKGKASAPYDERFRVTQKKL